MVATTEGAGPSNGAGRRGARHGPPHAEIAVSRYLERRLSVTWRKVVAWSAVILTTAAVAHFQPLRFHFDRVETIREPGRGGYRVTEHRIWVWDRWLQRPCYFREGTRVRDAFICVEKD